MSKVECEAVEVVAYVDEHGTVISVGRQGAWISGHDRAIPDCWDRLMTVDQHQRIVAAKDAEIARLEADNRSKNGSMKAFCEQIAKIQRAVKNRDKMLEKLRAQIAAQQADVPVGWTLSVDQAPRSGKAVLAFYLNSHGKGRRIRAEYIARWTVQAEGFDPDPDTECVEYSEQDDAYYILEGWYELIDNWDDYSRIAVNEGVITHWMDMPAAPAAPQPVETQAARDVLAERQRHVTSEGWTPDHDDEHGAGEMAAAAACYAMQEAKVAWQRHDTDTPARWPWPWSMAWWKPAGARRNLVKAGALILAEIERLDRAAPASDSREGQ